MPYGWEVVSAILPAIGIALTIPHHPNSKSVVPKVVLISGTFSLACG